VTCWLPESNDGRAPLVGVTDSNRRRFLIASGIAMSSALAGCSGSSPGTEDTTTTTETTTTSTQTTTQPTDDPAPPGADQLGGPDDPQAAPTVRAATLSEDQGAGRFVFTPAVVWIEPGTTVTWESEGTTHTVTAYHTELDKPHRVPEDAAAFDSRDLQPGQTYEHTFETPGVYNYYCTPHEGLGMVGVVVVDSPQGGPGVSPLSELSGTAASHLDRQLTQVAGLALSGERPDPAYGWQAATWDSYWYSLYNMSTNIAMSGNGITFPATEEQQAVFEERFPAMLKAADQDRPPVDNPNLNMAPFTTGDPHFTQKPVLSGPDGRPDASTLQWDPEQSSKVVSPASLAWTHLKGVTWAKNFQNHFDVLPESLAAEFRSEVLATLAQLGIKFSLADGNLRANEENMLLVSGFNPKQGVVDDQPRPAHHAAMLWFLGDMVSLASGGWFGYENPEPLIPAPKIQTMADGLGKTVMAAFPPQDLPDTRTMGALLGGMGWYGTHAGSDERAAKAAEYANGLAAQIEASVDANGKVANGAANQAATQGIVGQGLVWASQLDGVDHTGLASEVVGYMVDSLWDESAGTFKSTPDASTYTITARDAGDITGGLNAADAELGMSVKPVFARFFDQTMNRGRLQRAERPASRDPEAEHTLPLPPNAGGEFGQAAVYNAEVTYDTGADEWSVTDPTFRTEESLYLSNQEIWISHWGGDFYQGRGVPGKTDTPE